MRRTGKLMLAAAALAALAAFPAAGQTAPFSIRTQQGTNVQNTSDGGTFNLPADGIGLASNGLVNVTYTNPSPGAAGVITSIQLLGSTDFVLNGVPDLTGGYTLTTKSSGLQFNVVYTPSTSQLESAKIVFGYTDGTRTGSFSLNLTGVAPDFAFTYLAPPAGNSTLLTNGATAQLAPASVNATSTTTVVITNKGSGQGVVNNISYSGSPQIALAGLPYPPATVAAGATVQFSILFSPLQLDPVSGTVKIDLVAGRGISFTVQGAAQGPVYTYDLPAQAATLLPGQTITVPSATVGGDPTVILVRVRNTGNQDGRIPTLAISGTGFALTEAPVVPIPLTVGSAVTFKIQFTPAQAGQFTGKLQVGNDIFTVQATALGSNLIYSYTAGAGATTLTGGGTASFPPAAVGQTSSIQFSVQNNGTADTQINSISVSGPQTTTFALTSLGGLPLAVPAGGTVTFTITFAPTALGTNNGTLRIDTQTFTLLATGTSPAPLPGFSYTGASGTVDAAQQPAIGLSLASAYGLPLTGTLTLTFTPEAFANDPAVQFASGGRTVTFTIPAGSTQAVFPNNATQIRVQTGTVAGTISITPAFATQTSAIDVTPTNPPALTLSVPQSAPRLTGLAISNKTTNGFTLLVTGYATGRSITQIDVQFNPVGGENVATTKLSLNVQASFAAWYGSTASQAFGSQFTASIPLTMDGQIVNTSQISNLVDTIQSVSVTLTNQQGVSTAQSVNLK
ncbi:MAG TPA: choice-of-anchor D domain-containing protein [Bryobacteraceae bacterium]|nr:choice-of-anchor D domain-containing protein [Bryobacteraceae bacterium]